MHLPHHLKISTPTPPTTDPDSGNDRPGRPVEETVRGRLSQAPVANVGGQVELLAAQNTVVSLWTVLVKGNVTLTSQSEVEDLDTGRHFRIVGEVALRPDRHPKFKAASARLISDMQA